MTDPATVDFPTAGVWRVGRSPDPLHWSRPGPVDTAESGAGNRFDSFHGNYGVLYAGTSAEACFAETIARFRPDPHLRELVADEWRDRNWMAVGSVPADWRTSRILARIELSEPLPFVDVAAADTVEAFRREPQNARWLTVLGLADTDLGDLVGRDRRVTRLLSQWVFDAYDGGEPSFGGLRYMSRLGAEYECWAIFEGSGAHVAEPQPVLATNPDLRRVGERYELTIY